MTDDALHNFSLNIWRRHVLPSQLASPQIFCDDGFDISNVMDAKQPGDSQNTESDATEKMASQDSYRN
jgi:hypothetical protein